MLIVRTVRLVTGLILFSYAACHFLSHATGIFHLAFMEEVGRGVLLAPWRTAVGLSLLLTAFFVHGGLGLFALIRRQHLRMPALEAWQLGLGLSIPLLLIPHVSNVRLGSALYGLDDSYYRIVYQYWITSPAVGLTRQALLLTAVWVHGCLGLHMLLRFRRWYRHAAKALLGLAIAIPVLAVMGIMNAGWDAVLHTALVPGFSEQYGPPAPGSADAAHRASLARLWERSQVAYLALLAAVFLFRAARHWVLAKAGSFRVSYPNRQPVIVPRGHSVLEASRWAGVPHTSVCGGRGRCSTCRIRITEGNDQLPRPSDLERLTLERIKAPPRVRLACQLRPVQDLGVLLLLPQRASDRGRRFDFQEHRETAVAVDLRDSTMLAAAKLPFDILFVIDSYVQCVSEIIAAHGGVVTSVAGDGLMSVFGFDGNASPGAQNALAAAVAIWDSLDHLGEEFGRDLSVPLRFGIGIHAGLSIVCRGCGCQLFRSVFSRRHRQCREPPGGAEQGTRLYRGGFRGCVFGRRHRTPGHGANDRYHRARAREGADPRPLDNRSGHSGVLDPRLNIDPCPTAQKLGRTRLDAGLLRAVNGRNRYSTVIAQILVQ